MDSFKIRKLEKNDYKKGYLNCLKQLTVVDVSEKQFCERYDELSLQKETYSFFVLENIQTGLIVGCGSLFVEKKFIHSCGTVGHIEDIVISSNFIKKGLGKLLVKHIIFYAKERGCYKIIGNCKDELVDFYIKCGMERKNSEIVFYFK